jgi:hypothetical protein
VILLLGIGVLIRTHAVVHRGTNVAIHIGRERIAPAEFPLLTVTEEHADRVAKKRALVLVPILPPVDLVVVRVVMQRTEELQMPPRPV